MTDQNLMNSLPGSRKDFQQRKDLVPNCFHATSSPCESFIEISMEDSKIILRQRENIVNVIFFVGGVITALRLSQSRKGTYSVFNKFCVLFD